MLCKPAFFIAFVLQLFIAPAFSQYIFKGRIISNDSIPLQGVSIAVNQRVIASSGSNGSFEFNSKTDSVNMSFSFVGYQMVSAVYAASENMLIMLNQSGLFLEEAVVKAYEGNTALKNMAATISVLNKADLERYSNTSIIAAVNTVPGVKMDERSPGSFRLSIRGNLLRSPFGVRNIKVYWNGIPFTDANGTTYLNQVGFNNVGKIEILKGPGGSMYGAGTGGVVLLSTRNPANNEHSIVLNALAGSYGTYASDMTYKKSTENSSTSLSYAHQQSDGWRNHTNMRRDVAHYSGSFTISKKQSLHTNIFYSDLYYQTPGGITKRQMDSAAQQSRSASGPFRSAATQQAAIYLKTFYAGFANEYSFSDHWSNVTSVYTSHTRFKNPSILNYQRKTEQGVGGRSVTKFHRNNFTFNAGGEYQYGFTSTRTFGNKSGVPDTLQFDDEIAATQYNLFAQAEMNLLHGFAVTGGLSYNNFGYGFNRLNKRPVNEISKTFKPVLIPRIALIKKFGSKYSLYTTISKGYGPPTIDEIVPSTGVFNTTLDAENATNFEIGARAEIPEKLYITAAYYFLKLKNTIVSRRDNSGADFFVNAGNTNQQGFELAVIYYPLKGTSDFIKDCKLWINYTNIRAKFDIYQQGNNNYSGNKLTGTAPNVFVAGADILTRIGLYANVTYSFTDVIPLNDANTFFADQYNLLFARAGYKLSLGKKITTEIYCSFDKSFNAPFSLGNDLNAAGNRFFNPSAPQNFTGGLKLQFNL